MSQDNMAGVAKWLRQRVVIPPFAGSSPVTRPILNYLLTKLRKNISNKKKILCHDTVVQNYVLLDV